MTITLSKRMAVVLIALVGLLGGLALGQLTRADSAQTSAGPNLGPIVRQLQDLNNKLDRAFGRPFNRQSLLGMFDNITASTGEICQVMGGRGFQCQH